jgi:hypothetical protein
MEAAEERKGKTTQQHLYTAPRRIIDVLRAAKEKKCSSYYN